MMDLARLPVPAPPARNETVASYLTRLGRMHNIPARELWDPVSTPILGTNRRQVQVERLAQMTGRPTRQLMFALPELRDPAPTWAAWRHEPQRRCPRCDARHDGGPVQRLLPHHRYVCTDHRYWIGPPDADASAARLGEDMNDVINAQRRHLRMVRRHGSAAAYDAVLTGFLICGHTWEDKLRDWTAVTDRWHERSIRLIPVGEEFRVFSASRIFACVYPEAVDVAELIADPYWRSLAAGDSEQRWQFHAEIGRRLGRPGYRPGRDGDGIAHWMKYDSPRPPSLPHRLFPDTRDYGAARTAKISANSTDRTDRSAMWFSIKRRGGGVLLHHRHIRPVLIREWSAPMDGIVATIWASGATYGPPDRVAERSTP